MCHPTVAGWKLPQFPVHFLQFLGLMEQVDGIRRGDGVRREVV